MARFKQVQTVGQEHWFTGLFEEHCVSLYTLNLT